MKDIIVRKVIIILAVWLLLAVSLSACGKKPSFVDSPEGVAKKDYPRTYPNPSDYNNGSGGIVP